MTARRAYRLLALAVAACAALPLAVGVAPASAASTPDVDSSGGFTVSPMRLDVRTTGWRTITVENASDSKLTFHVGKEDVVGNADDPLANPVLTGGENASSISGYDWISHLPKDFSLAVGASKSFSVKVNIPSGASGGHYAAVTITGAKRSMGSGTAESRAAVLVMMNAGNTPPPDIEIIDVVTTGDGETVIDYVNKGNTEASPAATITYVDPVTGKTLLVQKESSCTTALPDGMGRCEVEALENALASPSGLVKPEVELTNDGRSARAALPTEWSGSWLPFLLPLIGAAMLAYYVYRRRRAAAAGLVDDGFEV